MAGASARRGSTTPSAATAAAASPAAASQSDAAAHHPRPHPDRASSARATKTPKGSDRPSRYEAFSADQIGTRQLKNANAPRVMAVSTSRTSYSARRRLRRTSPAASPLPSRKSAVGPRPRPYGP